MYYLQTRWYDPETGRFINLDQISYLAPETLNGLNLYAYCGNNPVMGYDPEGTAEWWEWVLVTAAIVACAAVAVVSGGTSLIGAAAAGAAIAGTTSVGIQLVQTGDINVGQVTVDIISGAGTGFVGASSATIFESFVSGAAINAFAYLDTKMFNGEEATVTGMALNALYGGVLGLISGPGARNWAESKVTEVIPQSVPKLVELGNHSFDKALTESISKNMKKVFQVLTFGMVGSNFFGRF